MHQYGAACLSTGFQLLEKFLKNKGDVAKTQQIEAAM